MSKHGFLVAAVLAVVVAGCGGSKKYNSVDVSGVVTLDGEPVEGAQVTFFTEEFTGAGMTDSQGKYTLVQGAMAGNNKVIISKMILPEGFNEDPEAGMDAAQMEAATGTDVAPSTGPPPGEQLAAEYSDPEQTILSFSVPEDGVSNANFKLTSD